MLIAFGVVFSFFSIPVGASKCFPVQHLVNVIAGVLLGPVYAVIMAFLTSLIRLMMGTGTILAFPGSMFGALLSGVLFVSTGKLIAAFLGEVFGTGILGALAAYPIAAFLLGSEVAIFAYVIPFLISTLGGVTIAAVLLHVLDRLGFLEKVNGLLHANQVMLNVDV